MNYLWSNQQSGPLNIVSPTLTTVYTVTASSMEGCLGSSESTVVVNALPTATLTSPAYTFCLNAAPQTLTGTPQGGFFSGVAMGGDQFIPLGIPEGTYVINYKYTDENNCEANDSETVSVISCTAVSVLENQSAQGISIFPVPATSELKIYNESFSSTAEICIFNMFGQQIQNLTMREANMLLDISQYQQGVYFLKIKNKQTETVLKFIKE
jgi:hypothetical protein